MKPVQDYINEATGKTLHILFVNQKNWETVKIKMSSQDKLKKLLGHGANFRKHAQDVKPSELQLPYKRVADKKLANPTEVFVFEIIISWPFNQVCRELGVFTKKQMNDFYEAGFFDKLNPNYEKPMMVIDIKELTNVMGETWLKKHCDEAPPKYLHIDGGWHENTALNRWLLTNR